MGGCVKAMTRDACSTGTARVPVGARLDPTFSGSGTRFDHRSATGITPCLSTCHTKWTTTVHLFEQVAAFITPRVCSLASRLLAHTQYARYHIACCQYSRDYYFKGARIISSTCPDNLQQSLPYPLGVRPNLYLIYYVDLGFEPVGPYL